MSELLAKIAKHIYGTEIAPDNHNKIKIVEDSANSKPAPNTGDQIVSNDDGK